MRELFLVGIKLYGALSLFSLLTLLLGMVQIAQLGISSADVGYQWLISMAVSAAIVYAAIFQAERLADVFGLTGEGAPKFANFSAKESLRVGLIFIAVNRVIQEVPSLLQEVARMADPDAPHEAAPFLIAVVRVALPIALIWWSKQAGRWIEEISA